MRFTSAIELLESRTLLTATLVRDINLSSTSSNPSAVVSLNGTKYFLASRGGGFGAELYQTDGTDVGTTLVKVLNQSGSQDMSGTPITVVGNSMYFAANAGTGAGTFTQLWKSDGTAAGTVLVSGAYPVPQLGIESFGGQAYFYTDGTNEPDGKRRLYRTDGSTTSPVGTFDLGFNTINNFLVPMNGWLYYVGNDGTHGYELCRTDGTTTENITDIGSGTINGNIQLPAVFNNRLYFSAYHATYGQEIWSTDGTTAGISLLKDIKPGTGGLQSTMTAIGGALYFVAEDSTHGGEPWVSDGTEDGTHMIMDVRPGTAWSNAGFDRSALGSRVFFQADDTAGTAYFATDGTEATTVRLGAFNLGGVATGGWQYVWRGGTTTKGLWRTDGTIANTTRIVTGTADGAINMRLLDSEIFFTGFDAASGAELFVSDFTQGGTGMVKELSTTTDTANPLGISVGGTMFFQANHGPSIRNAVYKSDGTAAGTVLLVDNNAVGIGQFSRFTNVNGTVYFAGKKIDGNQYFQLWKTDGTVAGTVKVSTQEFSILENFFPVGDKLVFTGNEAIAGHEFWVSDGTAAGTHVVTDLEPGPASSPKGAYQRVGDTVFFTLRNPDSDPTSHSLWKTDGTAAGTVLVKQMEILSAGNFPPDKFESAAIGGKLMFFTTVPGGAPNEQSLWVSDGTADGTVRIKTISSQGGIVYNDKYYFCGDGSDGFGGELWVTDGTLAGTTRLTDLVPGAGNAIPLNQVVAGTRILFTVQTPTGNTIGYYDAADGSSGMLWPAQTAGMPAGLTAPVSTGDLAYFAANIGTQRFLWQTDGTAAGTIKVPGHTFPQFSTYAYAATAANGSLFFKGNDGLTGDELWIAPSGNAPRSPETLSALRRANAPSVVDLQWTRDTDMNGYRLQRSTNANFATIDFTVNMLAEQSTYVDQNASSNTRYYYRLYAYNPAGTSAPRETSVAPVLAAPSKPHLDSDTGVSASDNITNDSTPTFSGAATSGTTVQIYADGLLVGGGPIVAGAWQATASALSDGTHDITAVAVDDANQSSSPSLALSISMDTVAPTYATAPVFAIAPSHRLSVTLSENLSSILVPASLQMSNLTNSTSIAPADVDITIAGNGATFIFTRVAGGKLTDGNWNATLATTDIAGNAFAGGNYSFIYATNSPSYSFYVRRSTDGANVELFNDGAPSGRQTPAISATFATLGQIVIEGTSAHQDVTVDLANGNVLPPSANNSGGFSLSGGAGTDDLTIQGAGSITLVGDLGAATPSLGLHVNDGAVVSLTGARIHLGGLTLDNGLAEANAAQPVVVASSLSITNGGKFDLRDGDLIVDYTGASSLAAVQALINLARAGGAWTGAGLSSSAAKSSNPKNKTLGAIEAADFKAIYGAGALFSGEPIDSSAVLVKFTYYGDTDFNGTVNFDDYSRTDAGFNGNKSGWLNGDFDGNGVVNFDDYSLIDLAFNTQGSPLRPGGAKSRPGAGR